LNLIGSLLKSKSGLEARMPRCGISLTVLQRKVRGRPTTTAPHLALPEKRTFVAHLISLLLGRSFPVMPKSFPVNFCREYR
jgi:hypothetical protein